MIVELTKEDKPNGSFFLWMFVGAFEIFLKGGCGIWAWKMGKFSSLSSLVGSKLIDYLSEITCRFTLSVPFAWWTIRASIDMIRNNRKHNLQTLFPLEAMLPIHTNTKTHPHAQHCWPRFFIYKQTLSHSRFGFFHALPGNMLFLGTVLTRALKYNCTRPFSRVTKPYCSTIIIALILVQAFVLMITWGLRILSLWARSFICPIDLLLISPH